MRNFAPRYVRAFAGLVMLALLWFVAVNLIGEWFVRAVYNKELPFANDLILGASAHPVDHYLAMLNKVAWTAFPAIFLFGAIVLWTGRPLMAVVLILVLATLVRVPGMVNRTILVDESYTLLETAGHAPPVWPMEPAAAGSVKYVYVGTPPLNQISETLRQIDVHPAVYYWAVSLWRQWLGFSLEVTRSFSLLCSIGTILALYLLLRSGRISNPVIPTLIFGMSAYSVYLAGVARNYALGSLLIVLGALCAYLGAESARRRNKMVSVAYLIAAGLFCGFAFQTHYFTLFSISVILLWVLAMLWPQARLLALTAPTVAMSILLVDFGGLLQKMAARPRQQTGFLGYGASVEAILEANVHLFWQPIISTTVLDVPVTMIGLLLIATTVWLIISRWQHENRELWALLLGLAFAPSVAIFVLDLTGKNIHNPQYISFAAPALAAVLGYPIATLRSSRRILGTGLLILVGTVQMVCINWGLEAGPVPGEPRFRSAAAAIAASWSPSQIVVVDAGCSDIGAGCGFQYAASLFYELDPRTKIVTFGDQSDVDSVLSYIDGGDDVWLGFAVTGLNRTPGDGSHDGIVPLPVTDIRKRLIERLKTSACHSMELVPGVQPELYHLKRLGSRCH